MPPADRQSRHAPGGHRGDGARRRGRARTVVIPGETGVRDDPLAIGDGDGGIAESRVDLVGDDSRRRLAEAGTQRRAAHLDDLEDLRRRRLSHRHDCAERVTNEPHPEDQAKR